MKEGGGTGQTEGSLLTRGHSQGPQALMSVGQMQIQISASQTTLDMTDLFLDPVMHKELSLRCDPSLNPVTSLCLGPLSHM